MKLPKKLFVAVHNQEEPYFQASADLEGAMEDDGPTEIGEYQLVSKKRYEKSVQVVERK